MKTCVQCKTAFDFSDNDRHLLDKMTYVFAGESFEIPNPTLCPTCAFQRRLLFRYNGTYHRRPSALSGKSLITMHAPSRKVTVYSPEEWWSDAWDGRDYGRDFDFSRSFFEQLIELFEVVPQMALVQDGSSENCMFTNYGHGSKNCYMALAFKSEDCYYAETFYCKDVVDSFHATQCEKSYEVLDSQNCYNVKYVQNSQGCSDSMFLENCVSCKNCLGCKNLRNKEYYIFNKPYSKEEYEKKILEYQLDSYSGIRAFEKEFEAFKLALPNRYNREINSENSTGDLLVGAKDCHDCFDVINGAENCRDAAIFGLDGRDVMRSSFFGAELGYEIDGSLHAYHSAFIHHNRYCSECLYSMYIYSCENLFGCISLKNQKYCILNKQYSKEEYEVMVSKIIKHMQETGEWGQVFPIDFPAFAYNESEAKFHFPLSKEEAIAQGFLWLEIDQTVEAQKKIHASQLPERIEDTPDDILNWAIECEASGRLYKIIPQELRFYRAHQIPVPHFHPEVRYAERFAKRNPYRLWDRQCDKCNKAIRTSFSPDRPELVYCEACYLEEVY